MPLKPVTFDPCNVSQRTVCKEEKVTKIAYFATQFVTSTYETNLPAYLVKCNCIRNARVFFMLYLHRAGNIKFVISEAN